MKSAADVAEQGLGREPRCAGGRQKEALAQTFPSSEKDTAGPTENIEGNFVFPINFLQSIFFLIRDIYSVCSALGLTKLNYQHKHL